MRGAHLERGFHIYVGKGVEGMRGERAVAIERGDRAFWQWVFPDFMSKNRPKFNGGQNGRWLVLSSRRLSRYIPH